MSLLSRLAALFSRAQPPKTTDDEIAPPPRPTQQARLFSIEQDRKAIVAAARRMVDEDPRAETALADAARDVTRGGFTVNVPQQPNAQRARQIAQDLTDRLNLPAFLEDMVRETWRDGDGFYELCVDDAGLIQEVSRKPTLEMRRLSNLEDRFPDPTRAYSWQDEVFVMAGLPPRDAVYFADWQLIHCRWNHATQERYGRPLFASSRQPWVYMTEGEKDIAVRRKTRAGMRYVHSLEDASEGDIAAYRERNKQALSDPNVAIADFFANKKTSIDAVQGDAHLAEIGDVEHHVTTAFFNSPIPLFLLGYGENLNRDVLEQQQRQYDRKLDGVSAWIDDQFLIPLIERQWLLQGIYPASIRYTIVRPSRTPITAKLLSEAAGAASALRMAGLPDEMIFELLAQLIPGLDVARILKLREAMQAQQAAQGQPEPGQPPQQQQQQNERRNGRGSMPKETVIYGRG